MKKDFLAKRQYNDKDALPIWDLFNNEGEDIGCLTNFDGEGFVATVKDKTGNTANTAIEAKYRCYGPNDTIKKCLANARKLLIDLQAIENLDLLTTEEMTPAQKRRDLKEYTEFHKIECNWDAETSKLHYDMQDVEPRNERVLAKRVSKLELKVHANEIYKVWKNPNKEYDDFDISDY
jgi:hypothetical protein